MFYGGARNCAAAKKQYNFEFISEISWLFVGHGRRNGRLKGLEYLGRCDRHKILYAQG